MLAEFAQFRAWRNMLSGTTDLIVPEGLRPDSQDWSTMNSERKAASNRRNAQRSTGPKSVAGKNVVRRNALRHGLTAEKLVVMGDDAEEFQAMAAAHMADINPRNSIELELCKTFSLAAWRRQRCVSTEAALTNQYIRDS